MDLREQFEKETNKKLETTTTFDCRGCDLEQEVDIWNDNYIFWLESKVKKLNIDDGSKKPEIQICYKDNKVCKYNCEGLCKESC
jgi:hypothetical protein